MKKKSKEAGVVPARKSEKELALCSSAAEYLTFVAATGESDVSFEMRTRMRISG